MSAGSKVHACLVLFPLILYQQLTTISVQASTHTPLLALPTVTVCVCVCVFVFVCVCVCVCVCAQEARRAAAAAIPPPAGKLPLPPPLPDLPLPGREFTILVVAASFKKASTPHPPLPPPPSPFIACGSPLACATLEPLDSLRFFAS
jgi:hypothetical protein